MSAISKCWSDIKAEVKNTFESEDTKAKRVLGVALMALGALTIVGCALLFSGMIAGTIAVEVIVDVIIMTMIGRDLLMVGNAIYQKPSKDFGDFPKGHPFNVSLIGALFRLVFLDPKE